MGSYSYLNITVRRKEAQPVTKKDLERFEAYFFGDDFGADSEISTTRPRICSDGMQIFASCSCKWGIDGDEMTSFAVANPHLQIEIIEESEDCDIGNVRHLYEGSVYERCREIRHFEAPRLIDWKEGE